MYNIRIDFVFPKSGNTGSFDTMIMLTAIKSYVEHPKHTTLEYEFYWACELFLCGRPDPRAFDSLLKFYSMIYYRLEGVVVVNSKMVCGTHHLILELICQNKSSTSYCAPNQLLNPYTNDV